MAAKETHEVMVSGNIIPTREFDRVKSAVCLLKLSASSSGTGFYVRIKLPTQKTPRGELHCIMTNHHVFNAEEKSNREVVAIFNHDGGDKSRFEVPLQSSAIRASNELPLDYTLIKVNKDEMSANGIMPLDVDSDPLEPSVGDTVYIIQHPKGTEKHFSSDRIKSITSPFIQYYADTFKGSSGSPVFVLVAGAEPEIGEFVLVALHRSGIEQQRNSNYNRGVLMKEIVCHLKTGKYTEPSANYVPSVPGMLESGTKDPNLHVADEDIQKIPSDICTVWKPLALALGVPQNTIDQIEIDHRHDPVSWQSYQMLLKWKQTKVSEANYGALAAGFRHPRVNKNYLIAKYC